MHLWWPLLLYRVSANGFHPTTYKVGLQSSRVIILPKIRASRYSHHLNQSALFETNWFFRVLGCNPYLNLYLIIYTTTPPWNLTKSLMEFRLSHTTSLFLTPEPQFYLKHYNFKPMLNQPIHPWFIPYTVQQSLSLIQSHKPFMTSYFMHLR